MKKIIFFCLQIIRGICFSFGDLGPGVSGSTTAVILNYYTDFITTVDAFLSPKVKLKDKVGPFKWLFQFGIGWIFGIFVFSAVVTYLTDYNYYIIASLFLGMVIAAVIIWFYNENLLDKKTFNVKTHWMAMVIAAFVVFALSYLSHYGAIATIDLSTLNLKVALFLFGLGIIVAGGMLLPGFGGSSFLVIFGVYTPMFAAITAMLSFNFYGVPYLIIFALGGLVGLALFAKIIHQVMEKHKVRMNYIVAGLMIGSIYSVMISPLEQNLIPVNITNCLWGWFILGIILIAIMNYFGSKTKEVK